MANGRGGIQFIPTLDRFAGLQQGALNLAGGLEQQFQQGQQVSDLQALLQFIQQTQQGGTPGLPQLQTPGAAGSLVNFLAGQPTGIEQQQAQANLALTQARTGQALTPTARPGFTLDRTRFDAEGNVIAEVPAAPLSPSQKIADLKLRRIQELQAVPEDQRTASQKESLKRLIEGQAAVQITFPKPASPSERTAIAETNASLDALNNLETLFNKSTTTTGPIAGRLETAKGFFGLSSEDQENLLAATAAFKNKVIKDITGAQMSEQEANRIMKQIPLETDPPTRWRAKKRQTEINLRAIQRRRIQVLQQSGIAAPGIGAPIVQPVAPGGQSINQQLESLDAEIRQLEALQGPVVNPRTGMQELEF